MEEGQKASVDPSFVDRDPGATPRIERPMPGFPPDQKASGEPSFVDRYPGATPRIERPMPDSTPAIESSPQSSDPIEQPRFGSDPLQLPPLNPIRCEDAPAIPGAKERAGWSIIQACVKSICNNLHINNNNEDEDEDSIDHEAIEILLASMERYEKESGYSFKNWRTAVKNVIAEAKQLEEAEDIARLTESMMEERERALTEAEMSLTDERIRLLKTENSVKNRSAVIGSIAAEMEAIEWEIDRLREQLMLRESDLTARRRELEAAEKEWACQQRNLERIKGEVTRREAIVRVVGDSLDTVEEDARAVRDRRQNRLRLSIARLQGFEIGHRHPGLLPRQSDPSIERDNRQISKTNQL